MNDTRLTEEQRRFAEEQHHILVNFLKRRNLAMDEYYDVVVFPFLEAVCEYDACRDITDDAFEVIAVRNMSREVASFQSEKKRQKRDAVVLSLDYPVSFSEGISFGDTVTDMRANPYEKIERKLSRPAGGYRLLHRYLGGNALKQIRIGEVCRV